MLVALVLAAASHTIHFSDARLLAAKEAIERARYQYVTGEKPPFEQTYPRSLLKRQLSEEHARESVLRRVFGITITQSMLRDEFNRIEKASKAPEQWEAMKSAVHGDRRLLEEAVCRPLLVDRALRARFDFDPSVHATAHEAARRARAEFSAGRTPPNSSSIVVSRIATISEPVDAMLDRARHASEGSVLTSPEPRVEPDPAAPLSVDPETAAVLSKELRTAGDVTTILEYRDRFEVYRLSASTEDAWKVDVVRFEKEDFEVWLDRQLKRNARQP